MQQVTLAAGTFEPYRKATRREIFLSEMGRYVNLHMATRPGPTLDSVNIG